jgi:hypothetical protein
MTPDQNQLVVLTGLEGSAPPSYTPLQEIIAPHVPGIIFFWWGVWVCVFFYMLLNYVVIPGLKMKKS